MVGQLDVLAGDDIVLDFRMHAYESFTGNMSTQLFIQVFPQTDGADNQERVRSQNCGGGSGGTRTHDTAVNSRML